MQLLSHAGLVAAPVEAAHTPHIKRTVRGEADAASIIVHCCLAFCGLRCRRFQRVHRSTIVNLDLVRQVKPHTNGECFLVLDSGAQVKVSRSYRDVVARFVH